MSHRRFPNPAVFRLTGSIGFCGTNNPEEVKRLQKLIADAGYSRITGRYITVHGKCDLQTQEAIYWYQRLLNMKPSGLVHPVDYWFMYALHEAARPRWRPHHAAGLLIVQQGQTTFDSEGIDYLTAAAPFRQPKNLLQFSRILHHPTPVSGVTIGRGFDMKKRSPGEILATLRQAGIEEYKAVICSRAAYLVGSEADTFVQFYGPLVGEITHQQQIRLFDIAYREKVEYGKGVYNRQIQKQAISNAIDWNCLDKNIREVFIDTLYQGNKNAPQMVKVMAKGGTKQEVINFLRTDYNLSQDVRRTSIRIRNLTK